MKRTILTSLAVLAAWWGVGLNPAAAQFGTLGQQQRTNPFVTPGTSNLQGGNFNTYGILRPPFDASRSGDVFNATQRLNPDGSLQGQLSSQSGANALGGLQTGHSVTFFDYSHYFPMSPYGGGAGSTGSIGSQGSQGFGTGSHIPATFQNTGTGSGFLRR